MWGQQFAYHSVFLTIVEAAIVNYKISERIVNTIVWNNQTKTAIKRFTMKKKIDDFLRKKKNAEFNL